MVIFEAQWVCLLLPDPNKNIKTKQTKFGYFEVHFEVHFEVMFFTKSLIPNKLKSIASEQKCAEKKMFAQKVNKKENILSLLSPGCVQYQCDQCTCSGTSTIVRQQSIFEFVLTNHVLGKFHVQLVFRPVNIRKKE